MEEFQLKERHCLYLGKIRGVLGFEKYFCYSANWTSNEAGAIDLLVNPMRYPIEVWYLFWVIPIRHHDAHFEARFDALDFSKQESHFGLC